MGFFSEFKKSFESGRVKAHMEAEARRNWQETDKVVKLIEPNYGRIVTFQVTEENSVLKQRHIHMLESVADGERIKANVSGDVVTLTFSEAKLAEAFRTGWGRVNKCHP